MKKLCVLLCVFLVAITMSACQAFHDETTQNHAQDNPLETVVFLRVKNLPEGSDIASALQDWEAAVRIKNDAITDENATKILGTAIRGAVEEGTYTFDVTIQNVPDSTLQKVTQPFRITYTQTVYNPIALLPESDVFLYIIGYTSERRHSEANTDQITTGEDGNYIYFWTNGETIRFVDVYPNRPLYYLIIVAGAIAIGVVVYLVSRYCDCKKRKKLL